MHSHIQYHIATFLHACMLRIVYGSNKIDCIFMILYTYVKSAKSQPARMKQKRQTVTLHNGFLQMAYHGDDDQCSLDL